MVPYSLPALSVLRLIVIIALFALAVLVAESLTVKPTPQDDQLVLDQALPDRIGEWTHVKSTFMPVQLIGDIDTNIDQPYDQIVMRSYQNGDGQQVMLALAWGRHQRQEVKIHRPELCYVAQGYQLLGKTPQPLAVDGHDELATIIGKRMLVSSPMGGEAVSYWVRIGSIFSESAVDTRWHIFSQGLKGRAVDGILVRASIPVQQYQNNDADFQLAEEFLTDLVAASSPQLRQMLLGSPSLALAP
ncbi:MAG: EpsI family protein [Gammaproteobacteria bacterium]|nr:EpsI family protein [Gammaproteobacteria bacterium]